MSNKIETNKIWIDNSKLWIDKKVNNLENTNLKETTIENLPKIVDICSENTEWYCKKLNLSLNNELINKWINFDETFLKTMNIKMKV